jgi:hypothetical protein
MENSEIESEEDLKQYLDKIKELSEEELYMEIFNIFEAKNNLRLDPYYMRTGKYIGLNGFRKTQAIKDLNDRILGIILVLKGRDFIIQKSGGNLLGFIEVLNSMGFKLKEMELYPYEFGEAFLKAVNDL